MVVTYCKDFPTFRATCSGNEESLTFSFESFSDQEDGTNLFHIYFTNLKTHNISPFQRMTRLIEGICPKLADFELIQKYLLSTVKYLYPKDSYSFSQKEVEPSLIKPKGSLVL